MRYVIPIAAGYDLFPEEEFHFPKPLVEIDGEPMIARVIRHIMEGDPQAHFIFLVRSEDDRKFSIGRSLEEASRGHCQVLALSRPTAGAACTVLMAVELIDDDHPLVVCNGDQIIEGGTAAAMRFFEQSGAEAGVITFPSVHPRWSYVRRDETGGVIESAEKRVISREAIAGFYYFKTGSKFVEATKRSIMNGRAVQGRYYISSTLNEFVLDGDRVECFPIEAERYQSLFSPKRVETYEREIQTRRLMDRRGARPIRRPVTVVIPMAGLGSRFSAAGYAKPKPFIDVGGKPMIERVMDNLNLPGARFVLIARQEHLDAEPEAVERLIARGDVDFSAIDLVTEGAACTVLTASALWDRDAPLLIANCDQIVDFSCADYLADATRRDLDGSILVFKDAARDPKWSFARLSPDGLVDEVKEKQPISDLATVGLYFFATAQSYVDASVDMISRNERVNNEFYVCPVYNHAIARGGRIGVFEVAQSAMHGIGTPDDLDAYKHLMGWD